MNPFCLLTNLSFVMLYRNTARRFTKGLHQADRIQEARLMEILQANKNTVYGKAHHFSSIRSAEAFRNEVPAATYEELLPFLSRMQEGEDNVLTAQRVRLFEPTSGSSSASKLIPYTDGLKSEFQEGIRPWLYDLYTRYPAVMTGKSYWSITPAASEKQYTSAGIPIGFEEDTGYFGRLEQVLMKIIFVKPKGIEQERNMDVFYHKTCYELLKTGNLTLISVWNPTYLLLLLDYMKEHTGELTDALPIRRRKKVREALARQRYDMIWPRLTIISCWCDAAAAGYRQVLAGLFPHAVIQPKGLLSTEAFMTIPWRNNNGGVASIYSHYFEFRDITTDTFTRYSQLNKDTSYEILLTTMGGLYRYRIRDIVKVTDYDQESGMPVLQFTGKEDKVCDLFGEKLNERFVQDIVNKYIPSDRFCLMAPEGSQYILYLERMVKKGEPVTDTFCRQLADSLEQDLCRNYHYAYCRRLGQLKALKVCYVSGNPRRDYLEACVMQGQKLGDIKLAFLSARQGWNRIFTMEEE